MTAISYKLSNEDAVKNLSQATAYDLKVLCEMEQRALKFKQRYEGTEISGLTFVGMSDNSFEEIYLGDIKSYSQFPWEYYKGIFIAVKYDKLMVTDSLDTTRLKVTEISFGGTFSPDSN